MRTPTHDEVNAEDDLLVFAYDEIVNGDATRNPVRSFFRDIWAVGIREDGTTFLY
jgi:hypothetical protein